MKKTVFIVIAIFIALVVSKNVYSFLINFSVEENTSFIETKLDTEESIELSIGERGEVRDFFIVPNRAAYEEFCLGDLCEDVPLIKIQLQIKGESPTLATIKAGEILEYGGYYLSVGEFNKSTKKFLFKVR